MLYRSLIDYLDCISLAPKIDSCVNILFQRINWNHINILFGLFFEANQPKIWVINNHDYIPCIETNAGCLANMLIAVAVPRFLVRTYHICTMITGEILLKTILFDDLVVCYSNCNTYLKIYDSDLPLINRVFLFSSGFNNSVTWEEVLSFWAKVGCISPKYLSGAPNGLGLNLSWKWLFYSEYFIFSNYWFIFLFCIY